MSGDKGVFIVIPQEMVQILPTSWRSKIVAMRRSVVKAEHGMNGIGRVGRVFIETFACCLAVNHFINNPQSLAMWA